MGATKTLDDLWPGDLVYDRFSESARKVLDIFPHPESPGWTQIDFHPVEIINCIGKKMMAPFNGLVLRNDQSLEIAD